MIKRLIINIVVLGLVAAFFVLLQLTNPNQDQFLDYLKESLRVTTQAEGASDAELKPLESEQPANIINKAAQRKDYIFFSLYSGNALESDFVFLGVFDSFIRIE